MIRPFPRRLGFPVHPAGGILVLPLSTLGAGLACCQQCLPISNAQESARGQLPKCSPVTSFCHSYCTIIYIGFFFPFANSTFLKALMLFWSSLTTLSGL